MLNTSHTKFNVQFRTGRPVVFNVYFVFQDSASKVSDNCIESWTSCSVDLELLTLPDAWMYMTSLTFSNSIPPYSLIAVTVIADMPDITAISMARRGNQKRSRKTLLQQPAHLIVLAGNSEKTAYYYSFNTNLSVKD